MLLSSLGFTIHLSPSAAVSTQALPARARDNHGLRDLKGPHNLLPVAVTQSYNPLIPDLGVLVNALTFLNINRLYYWQSVLVKFYSCKTILKHKKLILEDYKLDPITTG